MSNLEFKIKEFIENKKDKAFWLNELCNYLKTSEDNVLKYIKKLELDGKIFELGKNKYCLMPKNYFIGELQSTKKGKQYIESNNEKRIYINNDYLNDALNFDTVIVECLSETDEYINGRIIKVLKRKNSKVVCEVINTSTIKNLIIFNSNYKQKLTLSKEDISKLVIGDRIIVDFPINGHPSLIKKIGHKDDPDSDIKSIAASRDIEIEFNNKVLEETDKIPKEVNENDLKNRLDLREKMVFTIDSEHTKDMDDAVSVELLPNGNYKLGVHIANVSHYIKKDSELFKSAEERGNSVYLLSYVIAMFPHIISNGICSLNPNVDRLTKSCIMEIDKHGNIIDYKITNSVINSKKKMTYEAVNEILEKNNILEDYKPFINELKLMNNLSNILTKKRRSQGALELANDEIRVDLDKNGQAEEFNLEYHGTAEKMIENFMIMANEVIAAHLFWLGLPSVFRIHECPNENSMKEAIDLINTIGFKIKKYGNISNPKIAQSILNQLSNEKEFPILSNIFLRGMKRARYDTVNLGHFGLALDTYTHFTSPIRRFSDLLIHMLLDIYEGLDNIENLNTYLHQLESYLNTCCKHISYKERQAELAEEDANKFKMLEFMEHHIGEEFEATIMMIDSKSISIRTDSLITGKVTYDCIKGDNYFFNDSKKRAIGKNTRQQQKIGNKVLVKVKEVSKYDKEIYFYLTKNITNETKKETKILQKTKQPNY